MIDFGKMLDEELIELYSMGLAIVGDELKNRGYEYGWHKMDKYIGAIYILVNPAFPEYVKIGYADDVKKRMKSLSGTGVPDPYHCYAIYHVKERLNDIKLHKLIDNLDSDLRHDPNKEFYEMSKEKAYSLLSSIAQINGDESRLIQNPFDDEYFKTSEAVENDCEDDSSGKKKGCLTFEMLNIPIGSDIVFAEDESIVVKTCNNKSGVVYNGKVYSTSGIVRKLKEENGTVNKSGSYQGGRFLKYNGKLLVDIREELGL